MRCREKKTAGCVANPPRLEEPEGGYPSRSAHGEARPSVSRCLGSMRCRERCRVSPNFSLLDMSHPEVATLFAAMTRAREAVERRSWSPPLEHAGDDWWADVLADPRARVTTRRARDADGRSFYRLADETRATVLVECTKCDWRAAFDRDELVAAHGADRPMPDLLEHLARPGCARIGSSWDRCGVYYVEPIEADAPR
jgi:hypothetical protein